MKYGRQTHTSRWLAPVALGALLLSGCAGMRYHYEGMRLIGEGQRSEGVTNLRKASELEPSNAEYRMDFLKANAALAGEITDRADEAVAKSNLENARELYILALKIEPSNARARAKLQGIEQDARSARLVADAQRLLKEDRLDEARAKAEMALLENPGYTAAKRELTQIAQRGEKLRDIQADKAAERSIMRKPVTLQFRDANLRMVFEALSRTTGLNVILDRDVRADLKTTIFVKDAAVEDTVDLILLQNQLEKRSINSNTLFVYPATAAKQKEYQDLQVRSFQIENADVKYLQTVLKTVLKIKDVSVDERTNTLVMRDTTQAIAVAEKVIAAHDVPEPEIMLEVEVLEVSTDRLSNIGVQFPDSITLSVPEPADGLPLTLNGLRAQGDNTLLVSPLSLAINLKMQDTDANILASPRIRARNKEKARILIGDRVPIITNSVTPIQSGGGVVTGSVQYQDVGLKLEFEPQVYNENEVGIRIALEVSTIVKEIAGPNGSLAYQIGTRNANTAVRLRDGETQILGGLISAGDRSTASKVPGLGQLPILGRLFSNHGGTNTKSEIILSITPHILRAPAVLDASVRSVFSGTESNMRERALQLDPIEGTGAMAVDRGFPQGPATGSAPGTAPSLPLRARPNRPQVPSGNSAAAPEVVRNEPVVVPGSPNPIVRRPPLNNNTRPGDAALTAPVAEPPEPPPSDPPEGEVK
ncbi:secretin N-terminal domain-containing protein [Hydrogenophaga sp. PAMC20947]|uniref:secretin N-terminal domain-containing protein n=1 Tax=Hydrogenophaga sp. PAMC20947 TaxID=2565558 RepID=UPI001FFAB464|nr:secretin N-terminal domain-containing protein [Hydrogenophaga sp. PAMC20947]